MIKLKTIPYLLLLPFFLLVASCGGDGDDEGEDCTGGELTFNLNGDQWTAASFTYNFLAANDPVTGQDAKRFDIFAKDAAGNQLTITMNNVGTTEGACMDTGPYVDFSNATETSNTVVYSYAGTDGTFFGAFEGTLNITSCDAENKIISGNFTFYDDISENRGTDGVFTGLCF